MSLEQNAPCGCGLAFGFLTIPSAGTLWRPVREAPYVEPAVQAGKSLRSQGTNAAWDTAGGDGARKVRITYYDNLMTGPYTEDVTLAGTAWVNTVATDIRFIENIEVIEVGQYGSNQGTIELNSLPGGAGSTVGEILNPTTNDNSLGEQIPGGAPLFAAGRDCGSNRANWAHHYVAADRTMQLLNVIFGLRKSQPGEIILRAHDPTNLLSPVLRDITPALRMDAPANSTIGVVQIPLIIPGPAMVTVWGHQDGASGDRIHAGFTFNEY